MKTTARRLKLTHYELRILIEALNAKRLKKRANVIDNRAISNAVHFIVKRCTTNLNIFGTFSIRISFECACNL